MGRRSEHSLEQIKAMALEAAGRILTEQGLEGLSTRAIAKAMGYTSGTLYLVFRNLDDLVLQLNRGTIQGMAAVIQGSVVEGADPAKNVKAICRAYLKFGAEHKAHWELLFQRQWPSDFMYPAWYMAEMGKSFVVIEHELGRLLGPKAPAGELTMATRALWCSIHGVHALYASGRMERLGLANIQELIEYELELLVLGFKARAKV